MGIFQTLQVASRCCTCFSLHGHPFPRSHPGATVLVGVLQTVLVQVFEALQVAAAPHVFSSHGHPFSWAYFKHSRWPQAGSTTRLPSSHGHPFSCKYFKHSRWAPNPAAAAHVSSSHGHPFSWAYFKHSRRPRRSRTQPMGTRFLVPWAPVLVQVFQTLQVATSSRCLTRSLVPWAPVLVQVFQTLQVATFSRCSTHSHPMGTRSRGRISNTPGGHLEPPRARHTLSSHGHPFSCKYFKHSRWPPAAAARTFARPMGTRSRASIFKHSRWPPLAASRCPTRSRVPWAPSRYCKDFKRVKSPAPQPLAAHTSHPLPGSWARFKGGATCGRPEDLVDNGCGRPILNFGGCRATITGGVRPKARRGRRRRPSCRVET